VELCVYDVSFDEWRSPLLIFVNIFVNVKYKNKDQQGKGKVNLVFIDETANK
jgi:hypothetical protein